MGRFSLNLVTVFRHSSESAAQTTLGNTTKDIAYVLVSGIDQVDFGNKSMNACLKGGKKWVKNMTHNKWLKEMHHNDE